MRSITKHTGSLRTRRFLATPRELGEWRYTLLTIAAFVFMPEIRRLVDWRVHLHGLNVLAVVPLVMLLPIVIFSFQHRSRIHSRAFEYLSIAWSVGFAYGVVIAIAHEALFAPLYTAGQFVLPLAVGFWLLTRTEPLPTTYARLAKPLFVFGTIAGLYGIFQYVVAPPWDTEWLINSNGDSFGVPEPFGIRVFGVLNSPGPYAMFLTSVILFNLPYLRVKNVPAIAGTAVMIVGLALSLVRSGWLALALGVLIFLTLSPRKRGPLLGLGAIGLAGFLAIAAFILLVPTSNIATTLSSRVASLNDVKYDPSAESRQFTSQRALGLSIDRPLGAGLGTTGVSEKLEDFNSAVISGAPPGSIDNGFLSRFFETGYFGIVMFVLTGLGGILISFSALQRSKHKESGDATACLAACVATTVTIFSLNVAGDDQQGLLAVIFFSTIACSLIPSNVQKRHPEMQPRLLNRSSRNRLALSGHPHPGE